MLVCSGPRVLDSALGLTVHNQLTELRIVLVKKRHAAFRNSIILVSGLNYLHGGETVQSEHNS